MSIYERRVLTTTDRTHWTDPSGATVLPSTSITFNSDKKYYFTEPLALDIIDGNDYEVTWSGERYNAPAATMTAYGEECVYLGNKTGLDASPDLNQGSFLLIVLPESMRDQGYVELIALDNYSSANVEIVCVSENVHFLDKKYLANANGDMAHKMLVTDADGKAVWEDRTHYSYKEEVDYLLPETTYTAADLAGGAADIRTPVTVEYGKTYTVGYNGVDYQCTPLIMQAKPILEQFGITVDDSVMGGILGNVGVLEPSLATSEPFVLMVFQGTDILESSNSASYGLVMPLDGSTEITLSIQSVAVKKYKTIPQEYLPDSKKIIFTKGSNDQYTCNIPHAELWGMDADIIGKNACIIDGEKEYSARGATKKTETLYGNVIQICADLNVGKYDIPSLYHKTLIITYCTPELLGQVPMIYSEFVYSLSDVRSNNTMPDIPVLDGGGWLNRAVDFMEYDNSNVVYTLKTMSETTKGGAKVGTGLEVVDGYLNVKTISSDRINEICGSTTT